MILATGHYIWTIDSLCNTLYHPHEGCATKRATLKVSASNRNIRWTNRVSFRGEHLPPLRSLLPPRGTDRFVKWQFKPYVYAPVNKLYASLTKLHIAILPPLGPNPERKPDQLCQRCPIRTRHRCQRRNKGIEHAGDSVSGKASRRAPTRKFAGIRASILSSGCGRGVRDLESKHPSICVRTVVSSSKVSRMLATIPSEMIVKALTATSQMPPK